MATVQQLDTAQLKMSLHPNPLLPAKFNGKVNRLEVRGEDVICEVVAPGDYTSLVRYSGPFKTAVFPLAYREQDILSLASNRGKHLLNFESAPSDPTRHLNAGEIASQFNIPLAALRLYFPQKVEGRIWMRNSEAKRLKFLTDAIPKFVALGPALLSDDAILLSNQTELKISDFSAQRRNGTPYLDRDLLVFPKSKQDIRLETRGAFLFDSETAYSVDAGGNLSVVTNISGRKPTVELVGRLTIPEYQGCIVTGFTGTKGGNVLFASVVVDGSSRLAAFDRNSLEVLSTLDGVSGPLSCDKAGNVYFIDGSQNLRMVSTNLASLTGKRVVSDAEARTAAIRGATEILSELTLPEERQQPTATSVTKEASALLDLQKRLLDKIAPEITKCGTLDDLSRLASRIQPMRVNPELKGIPLAFELVDKALADKKESLAYPEIESRIKAIQDGLNSDNRDLPEIRSQFFDLARIRSSVVLGDSGKRETVGQALDAISCQLQALNGLADSQAEKQVEIGLVNFKKELASCATRDEVLAVAMEGNGRKINETIEQISATELRDKLSAKVELAQSERVKEIDEKERAIRLAEADQRLAVTRRHKELVQELEEALTRVTDRTAFQNLAGSALVRTIRNQIEKFPTEEQAEANTALGRLFAERSKVIDFSQRVHVRSNASGFVKFGEVDFPRAGDFEIPFVPNFIPIEGRQGFLQLVWRDARGREHCPDLKPLAADASKEEQDTLIAQSREEAGKFFMCMTPRPPTIRGNWVMNRHFERYLGELAELLHFQAQNKQGLAIIEGDAGVAKSGLVQMFCALTNRPMSTFACSGQTEK